MQSKFCGLAKKAKWHFSLLCYSRAKQVWWNYFIILSPISESMAVCLAWRQLRGFVEAVWGWHTAVRGQHGWRLHTGVWGRRGSCIWTVVGSGCSTFYLSMRLLMSSWFGTCLSFLCPSCTQSQHLFASFLASKTALSEMKILWGMYLWRFTGEWQCNPLTCIIGALICSFHENGHLKSANLWHDWIFFPNSRALLPTSHTNFPDGSHFAQMGSHLPRIPPPTPVLYSAVTNPFGDMYVHKKTPTPPQNTPFPGLNLKVGKRNYSLGKMDPNRAKCLKSGQNFSRSGQKKIIHTLGCQGGPLTVAIVLFVWNYRGRKTNVHSHTLSSAHEFGLVCLQANSIKLCNSACKWSIFQAKDLVFYPTTTWQDHCPHHWSRHWQVGLPNTKPKICTMGSNFWSWCPGESFMI